MYPLFDKVPNKQRPIGTERLTLNSLSEHQHSRQQSFDLQAQANKGLQLLCEWLFDIAREVLISALSQRTNLLY